MTLNRVLNTSLGCVQNDGTPAQLPTVPNMTIKSWMIVADGDNHAYLRILMEDGTSHHTQLNRRALMQLANQCLNRALEMEST